MTRRQVDVKRSLARLCANCGHVASEHERGGRCGHYLGWDVSDLYCRCRAFRGYARD